MPEPQLDRTKTSDIGEVQIVPSAETIDRTAPATVSAADETKFYRHSGEEAKLQQGRQELGFLGQFFGSYTAAPTNTAGFIAVASLVIYLVSYFVDTPDAVELRRNLITLISSALAYIFGAGAKK